MTHLSLVHLIGVPFDWPSGSDGVLSCVHFDGKYPVHPLVEDVKIKVASHLVLESFMWELEILGDFD